MYVLDLCIPRRHDVGLHRSNKESQRDTASLRETQRVSERHRESQREGQRISEGEREGGKGMYSFISTDWYTISSVYQHRGGVSRGLVVRTPETTQADLVVGFVSKYADLSDAV